MPSHTRATKLSAKQSVKRWIDSVKNKGYKRIVCNKCCHKWVANDSHKYAQLEAHYLKCDPAKVQWCYVCSTHSTTSDIEMRRHIARQHPNHLQLKAFKTFHTQKIPIKPSDLSIKAISIQWFSLDKDTLFQNPEIFKPVSSEQGQIDSTERLVDDIKQEVISQSDDESLNFFTSREAILKNMRRHYPIAAIDVETAAYYNSEDMNKLQIQKLYAQGRLGHIISIGIVTIDENMNIQRETFTFKPSIQIDPRATKIHGFDDNYFEQHSDLYQYFTKHDAKAINKKLMKMKEIYAHNQSFDYFNIVSLFQSVNAQLVIPAKFNCTYELALELGLPLSLRLLTNALNIGQRKNQYHTAEEDAEMALIAAVKMLWLKSKGLKNIQKHLCWFQNIQSRGYDKDSLDRLSVVLMMFKKVLNNVHDQITVIELCAGHGRNINNIIECLQPQKFIAIDYKNQCVKEINERWQENTNCHVNAAAQKVSSFIFENNQIDFQAIIGHWCLGYMSMHEQMELLEWIKYKSKSIALFIEPIGKGEIIDDGKLKANTKAYYDHLFNQKGLKILKEGKFIWTNNGDVFEHYSHSVRKPKYIKFNSTYFWIVS